MPAGDRHGDGPPDGANANQGAPRYTLLVLAAAMAHGVPGPTRAQVSLGARIGYAPAFGDAMKDPVTGQADKMSDGVKAQIPLQLEAAWRATKEVALGAYFSYGIGQNGTALSNDCAASGQSCSTSDMRFGVQLLYAFPGAGQTFVPWVGAGLGYEWAKIEQTGGGLPDLSATFSGWEFLNLQVGGDWALGPQFSIGPYLMLSIAQYSNIDASSGGQSASQSIAKKAVHEWIGFGIRGKIDL